MATVVVRWMRPCACHLPLGNQRVILAPGDNQLDADTWHKLKQVKGVKKRLDKRLLIEVPRVDPDPHSPGEVPPPELPKGAMAAPPEVSPVPEAEPARTEALSLDSLKAKIQIEACHDLATLAHWGRQEKRDDVQAALRDRYFELGGK